MTLLSYCATTASQSKRHINVGHISTADIMTIASSVVLSITRQTSRV